MPRKKCGGWLRRYIRRQRQELERAAERIKQAALYGRTKIRRDRPEWKPRSGEIQQVRRLTPGAMES